MTPQKFAGVLNEIIESYQVWSLNQKQEKENVDAYAAGAMFVIGRIGELLNDHLDSDPVIDDEKGKEFEEGYSHLDDYINTLVNENGEWYRTSTFRDALIDYYDEYLSLIMAEFRAYTNNPDLREDEDDGINGEESVARHWIFDGVIGSIPALHEKKVNKDGVVRALRKCADYIETMNV